MNPFKDPYHHGTMADPRPKQFLPLRLCEFFRLWRHQRTCGAGSHGHQGGEERTPVCCSSFCRGKRPDEPSCERKSNHHYPPYEYSGDPWNKLRQAYMFWAGHVVDASPSTLSKELAPWRHSLMQHRRVLPSCSQVRHADDTGIPASPYIGLIRICASASNLRIPILMSTVDKWSEMTKAVHPVRD